jgi:hypothetical protein
MLREVSVLTRTMEVTLGLQSEVLKDKAFAVIEEEFLGNDVLRTRGG